MVKIKYPFEVSTLLVIGRGRSVPTGFWFKVVVRRQRTVAGLAGATAARHQASALC